MTPKERAAYAIQSGLPRRHVEKIEAGDPMNDEVFKCCEQITHLCVSRNTVLVRGGYGSGKTHMACAIGYNWPSTGRGGVRYQTVCGLLIEIKGSFNLRTTGDGPLEKALKCGLLILDELLANTGSVFDQATIRELIDSRYRNMKPTIILTNLDDAGLLQALDKPTIDRMMDGGCVVTLKGKSLRA